MMHMRAADLYYTSSATTAHRRMDSTTTTREMSTSKHSSKTDPQPQCVSPFNDVRSPLPLRPLLEHHENGIAANNRLTDGEVVMRPLSTDSRLFGGRVLRFQNRYTLPRVEWADGSTPFSRELLELPPSPLTIRAQPDHHEPNIEELVTRYASPTPSQHTPSSPSSPSLSTQHWQAARGLNYRTHDYFPFPAPRADADLLRTSRSLLRVAARQSAAHSSPFERSGINQSFHRKNNSVSTFGQPQDTRQSGASSASLPRSRLRHKRSSTEPLDEWIEAGSLLVDNPSKLRTAGPLRASEEERSGSLLAVTEATRALRSTPSTPDHSSSSYMISHLTSTTLPSKSLSLSMDLLEDFVDFQRSSSLSSSGASSSSDFSFLEPHSLLEPAVDILARAESRKSVEQRIKDVAELRFDGGGGSSVGASSEVRQTEAPSARKDVQDPGVEPSLVESMAVADFSALPSTAPTQALGSSAVEEVQVTEQVLVATNVVTDAATVVIDTQPTRQVRQLSLITPKVVFEQLPLNLAETDSVPSEARPPSNSSPGAPLPHDGLNPLAIVIIVGAWISCALLRSLVRSMANAEPVQASRLILNLLVAVVLAVVTCVGFHVSLGGRVEVSEDRVQ
jgi:hypothetical protein